MDTTPKHTTEADGAPLLGMRKIVVNPESDHGFMASGESTVRYRRASGKWITAEIAEALKYSSNMEWTIDILFEDEHGQHLRQMPLSKLIIMNPHLQFSLPEQRLRRGFLITLTTAVGAAATALFLKGCGAKKE